MHVLSVCALGVLMMLVGLVDDFRSLRPVWKFMLQAAVAVAAWMADIRIESLGAYWGDGFHLGVWSLPITVLWIVGITNAFNLLDGIDGLAAGAALFATMAMLGVAIISHQVTTALILAAIAGATAAFLRYNFNPASIFLGDSGSLFLGFTLSVLAIQSTQKSAAAFAVAVPIVSLGVPVLDTMVVVFRRLVSGRPVFTGDRRHIHHMLLDRGLSVRQVAMGMYAVSGALALVSLLVASPSASLVGPVLAILGIAVAIGVQQLRIPELRVLEHPRRAKPLPSTIAVGVRDRRPEDADRPRAGVRCPPDAEGGRTGTRRLRLRGGHAVRSGLVRHPVSGGGRMAGLDRASRRGLVRSIRWARRACRRAGAHERRVAALRRRATGEPEHHHSG